MANRGTQTPIAALTPVERPLGEPLPAPEPVVVVGSAADGVPPVLEPAFGKSRTSTTAGASTYMVVLVEAAMLDIDGVE